MMTNRTLKPSPTSTTTIIAQQLLNHHHNSLRPSINTRVSRTHHTMPLIRPSSASNIVRSTSRRSTNNPPAVRRPLSTTATRQAGHAPHYDPPTGWLWGVPPGTKRKKESWENLMIYGYCGSFVVAGIAYVYKPDTR
jgi:hypothetical protein